MRILITGGAGRLGRALVAALGRHGVIAADRAMLDVTHADAVHALLRAKRPDAVIHAAALTDTTACERDESAAMRVNAGGAENVARACAALGARLIAVSTNEVFDGEKREPYLEDDAAAAINAYGRSKLEGERRTLAADPEALIVRTSWLYGGGADFAAKVLDAARGGRRLRFVTDEVASPTSADDLATAIREILLRDTPAGIYHLANDGEASRYDWACEIVRLAKVDATVEATTSTELRAAGYVGPAKPPYSVLANTRAAAVGISTRPWREALAAHFDEHGVVAGTPARAAAIRKR